MDSEVKSIGRLQVLIVEASPSASMRGQTLHGLNTAHHSLFQADMQSSSRTHFSSKSLVDLRSGLGYVGALPCLACTNKLLHSNEPQVMCSSRGRDPSRGSAQPFGATGIWFRRFSFSAALLAWTRILFSRTDDRGGTSRKTRYVICCQYSA